MNKFESKFKDNASLSVGFSFIRAYNLWHRQIKKQLQTLDITHPQYVVLACIGYLFQAHEEITQILIAQNADMDVMTVSTILKNLEIKELVKREVSTYDTRAKCVVLTEAGQEILTQSLSIVENIDETFFSKLGENENLFNNLLMELINEN